MKLIVRELTASLRRIDIQVPGSEVRAEVSRQANELRNSTVIPGFRKGRVPLSVIQRKYGDEMQTDAIQKLGMKQVVDFLRETKTVPIHTPYFGHRPVADEDDIYEANVVFDVWPKINDATLKGTSIKVPVPNLSEDDIDEMIEYWQISHQAFDSVDEPAAIGDLIILEIESFTEGISNWGAAEPYELVLIEEDEEWPELRDTCLGRTTGDRFSIKDSLFGDSAKAEDSEQDPSELSKSDAEIKAEVIDVKRPLPGQFREDFLQLLGVTGRDDENFRNRAREKIESDLEMGCRAALRQLACHLLLKRNPFDPPMTAVEMLTIDQLRKYGLSEDEIKKLATPISRSESYEKIYCQSAVRLKLDLILNQFQKDRDIRLDEDEVEAHVENQLRKFNLFDENDSEDMRLKKEEQSRIYWTTSYRQDKLIDAVLQEVDIEEDGTGLSGVKEWIDEMSALVWTDLAVERERLERTKDFLHQNTASSETAKIRDDSPTNPVDTTSTS